MHQPATNVQGEILARASGHGAIPPVEDTPATNGMGGAGTSARDVPLAAGDDRTSPIAKGTLTKADTMSLLKNKMPPMFEGEKKGCCKHLFT